MNEIPDNEAIVKEKFDKYMDRFKTTPSKELNALEEGGQLLPDNRNILQHSLKARIGGGIICDLLGIKGKEKQQVESALTLHDCYVLREKEYIRGKLKSKSGASYNDFQKIKTESANKLRSLGIDEEVISLTDENITHEEGGPRDDRAMIVFFMDGCLDGSEIVDMPTRFEKTRKGWRSDWGKEDEETARGNLKYWIEVFNGAPGHGNRRHDIVQLETGARICREFTERLKETQPDTKDPKYDYIFGPNGDPNMLPYYIRDKVNERITGLLN